MANTSNLKDTITTIAGLAFAICSGMLSLDLPQNVKVILGIIVAISGGLIGYFTGKSPRGVNKTDNQLSDQNKKNL